jgi:hypothetical protein
MASSTRDGENDNSFSIRSQRVEQGVIPMIKTSLAAVGAAVACSSTAALGAVVEHRVYQFSCDPRYGCEQGIYSPAQSLDYFVPDDGHTYKWTYLISLPGATFDFDTPNQVEYYKGLRTDAGYDILSSLVFPHRFEKTVAPNITTLFVWVPQGQDFTCDQPGKVGELCYLYYRVWGNGTQAYFTGIPKGTETFMSRSTSSPFLNLPPGP